MFKKIYIKLTKKAKRATNFAFQKALYIEICKQAEVNSIKCTGFFKCNMLTTLHKIQKKKKNYNQKQQEKKSLNLLRCKIFFFSCYVVWMYVLLPPCIALCCKTIILKKK